MNKKHFKIKAIIKTMIIVIIISLTGKITMLSESEIINKNLNKTLDLHAMSKIVEEINYDDLYTPVDSYVGYLTGYGALCPKCSGFLGCNGMDVRDGTTTYKDDEYGSVRIVASSKAIKCGSIVRFESDRVADGQTIAIVLDRGVSGTALDLLTESEKYAGKNVGRQQIKYDLLRSGWDDNNE